MDLQVKAGQQWDFLPTGHGDEGQNAGKAVDCVAETDSTKQIARHFVQLPGIII